MRDENKGVWRYLLIAAVVINLAVFLYVNTRPANWTNDEILCHGFFWSADSIQDPNLHTGFTKADWAKVFGVYYVDGSFRTRQFSYLLEMVSFKFWQEFGEVFFRNYTLIFLHAINAFLLGFLVHLLTKNKALATAAALSFLNSGPAIATLLYPFRNAKLLVVTLFLLAWIAAARSKKIPLSVYVLFIFAAFTDEQALFLFPMIFLYVFLRDGREAVLNRDVFKNIAATVAVFVALAVIFLKISHAVSPVAIHTGAQGEFFKDLMSWYANPVSIKDIALSFGRYFMRRNFGHWDVTLLGAASLLAFVAWIILIVKNSPRNLGRKLCLGLAAIFFLKTILLPHNSGYHIHFMPEGTVFPSLLFFSYYYVYIDAALLGIFVGICGKEAFAQKKMKAILLAFVTLWGVSNAVHLKNGPADVLAFNYFHTPERQKIVADVKAIDPLITQKENLPIYLSFPAGDSKTLRGRRHDPVPGLYGRMIPVRLLRFIEEGKVIVSYDNAAARKPFAVANELSNAKYFYDVIKREGLDLESLRRNEKLEEFKPIIIPAGTGLTRQVDTLNAKKVILFVKGGAAFILRYAGKEERGVQLYGESYQMFQFDVNPNVSAPVQVSLSIKALGNTSEVYLVGPFGVR